jgi:hypothetical protein
MDLLGAVDPKMKALLLGLVLFQASPPPQSDVRGHILLKTGAASGSIDVRAGGRGGEGAVMPIEDERIPAFRGLKSFSWDNQGLAFHFLKLPSGMRLVTVAWRLAGPPDATKDTSISTHYVDWKWVEAKVPDPQKPSPELALLVQPSVSGAVEVLLGAGLTCDSVSFMPADVDGRVPTWDDYRGGPAYSEKVAGGKALFKGMKPGKYVFYPTRDLGATGAPEASGAATVRENSQSTVTIAPERK